MERFTISLDDALAAEFDRLMTEHGYANRSEAVRDILRVHLDRWRESRDEDGPCVANLSYIYNHHERELAERLTRIQHAHHGLTVSTMHAHLDDKHCIETVILRGPAKAVRHLADAISSERGVKQGQLNLIMTSGESGEDGHGRHGHHHHPH
ncbi:nickel-responsive transcriptional regulator NikR [Ralstonia sp. UBA689]|uniref:nickel-responsive transcriptional regulator NikR n=1 Tax=Ralstonia sp. UBA689 TaxID=1947373 RepID=UPI0025F8300F|nr:nickel-responsive transcriptional regulator NikR [Ralstonia sp. UBA689]